MEIPEGPGAFHMVPAPFTRSRVRKDGAHAGWAFPPLIKVVIHHIKLRSDKDATPFLIARMMSYCS
jgi:hypothetical protein